MAEDDGKGRESGWDVEIVPRHVINKFLPRRRLGAFASRYDA